MKQFILCRRLPQCSALFTKTMRIMKITAFILLAACLQVSAAGFSQKVTLSLKDAPLDKVFTELHNQTGYAFFYDLNEIKTAKPITVDVRNKSLEETLLLCLSNQPVDYKIVGKTVVVKASNTPATTLPVSTNTTAPPTIDISGKVTDENGNPLVGATVAVKGTKIATTTDAGGVFVLNSVDENAVLEITYAEYEKITIKLNGRSSFVLAMKKNYNPLDEVQVIAYGSKSRREQLGNVSTVKADDIAKQPVNNPLLALAGRVPGLLITQSKGLPGSAIQVTIQGQNSINRGNDPFYVIDGVPYTSQLLVNYGSILGSSGSGISGNPLSFINPADIESISVLKDADATAIYGSRGANGVILITTKKGKAGQTRVDINMQTGWGKVTRKLDLLNTEQYLQMRNEALINDGLTPDPNSDFDLTLWDTTRNTNWQKELIGNTAHYTDVNATVSGGNSYTQVLAGVGYHRETTVFPGDLSDQKGSLHFSMNNVSTNQKFRMQLTGNYLEDNNRLISGDLTEAAILLAPNAPKIYDENGALNWMPNSAGVSTWTNPLANYLYRRYKNKTKNLVGNAVISYQIIPALEIKGSFGYTNMQSNDILTNPLLASRPEDRLTTQRFASYSNNNISSWIIEPQISYKTKFANSRLEALVGATIQQNSSDGLRLRGTGYNSDIVLEDIKSASTVTVDGTVNAVYKYNALFTRISYNLLDKYLLNLTARRDGSSRFGSGNQFHNFGAAAIGWIFSKENFIQNSLPFLSFGKLTASFGTTGNDQIGDYQFMTLYSPPSLNVGVPYQGVTGLRPNGLSNAFLQWEETKKMYLGLDLGLFKERILITTGYFHNRSSNQLLSYLLPIQTGFTAVKRNLPATVQNSGWEFTMSTTNIKTKNFSWSTDVNLTIPKNKLLEFPGIESSGYASSYQVGESITSIRLYQFAGVDSATGIYQFVDHKGNLTSSPDYATDRTVSVNTAPVFYGGIKNSFRYKSFELDLLFQFVKRKGANYFFGESNGASFNTNQPVSVLDRWQKPGDITSIQRYNSDYSFFIQSYNASQLSDAAYTDASFVRLKNLSLTWNMPQSWYKKAKLNNVRLYIQGQNLITITKYKGLDPETLSSTSLPPLKVLTVGFQIGL